ncbi:unnamed protein product [Soboliphyme baturini]|uniref:Uncharacterized protein n=1 Tax=Soboliphyme baturini TaxID=241478 RepID=A0A183J8R2_9BILA|nr:unnamed protein product [Soboliphyme baturini]
MAHLENGPATGATQCLNSFQNASEETAFGIRENPHTSKMPSAFRAEIPVMQNVGQIACPKSGAGADTDTNQHASKCEDISFAAMQCNVATVKPTGVEQETVMNGASSPEYLPQADLAPCYFKANPATTSQCQGVEQPPGGTSNTPDMKTWLDAILAQETPFPQQVAPPATIDANSYSADISTLNFENFETDVCNNTKNDSFPSETLVTPPPIDEESLAATNWCVRFNESASNEATQGTSKVQTPETENEHDQQIDEFIKFCNDCNCLV